MDIVYTRTMILINGPMLKEKLVSSVKRLAFQIAHYYQNNPLVAVTLHLNPSWSQVILPKTKIPL